MPVYQKKFFNFYAIFGNFEKSITPEAHHL